jgi:cytochrome P450
MVASILRPPGPRGHFLFGSLRDFARDRLGFFTHCAREYGDVVSLRLATYRAYCFYHPDAIEEILVTQNQNFIKHRALRMNRLVLGNGMLTSAGPFWLRQRRLAQPAFNRQRIAAYGPTMVGCTERMLAGWRDGETRDVHADMMHLTLAIAAETLFGADVGSEAGEVTAALAQAMASFDRRISSAILIPRWVPTPMNLRARRIVRQLDAIIYRFIEQRRKSGVERGDLLSLLLQARDADDGTGMTDQQLRDEAMTLFLAGHETTALSLSWTWYLLGRHPEAEAKLHAELAAVLGGRPPTVADLPRLPYTERVVQESLRLYPPAYGMGREAIRDCEIGGYPIPKGLTIFLAQWVVQRDSRWYDQPEKFDPDRWADGLQDRLPKFAYFPFGGGPRLCIGQTFALMETALVLATVAQRYRLELVPDHPVVPWPSLTLRPKHGIKVVLRRRAP